MFERRIPEWLRHPPSKGIQSFALLTGLEAIARGILISVFPLEMYKALGNADNVSKAYFFIGLIALVVALLVPLVNRRFGRQRVYKTGCTLYIFGCLAAMPGIWLLTLLSLLMTTVATVIMFVCLNAYVLDFVSRSKLSSCETQRMFYAAFGWTIGPVTGVWLHEWLDLSPFLVAMAASGAMLASFTYMRMGDGRKIGQREGSSAKARNHPGRLILRFMQQPRLVTGWLFAVTRSCGWWLYVVYLPIFCIENGLGGKLGGIVLSITNAMLFLTPFLLRLLERLSVRGSVRLGFFGAGMLFGLGGLLAFWPTLTVAFLLSGSVFLIFLDICGGLPFLMSVKPSERTEMSAIYSSFRDVSGILTPGGAWLVLTLLPLPGVFVMGGLAMFGAWSLASRLHPRLGRTRVQIKV